MNIRILLLLFTAMLAVSTSPIIARYLVNVPAVSISFWRMGFGAMILWGFSLIKKQSPLEPENRKRTIIAGIFLGIHFVLFFAAIKLTSIANATFLGTLAPLFTLLIEKYLLKRKHQPSLFLGLGLTLLGAIIIVGNQFDFSSDFTLGNILAVLCSIFLGMTFIISEGIRKKTGTITYSRTLFISASITLMVIAYLNHSPLTGFTLKEYVGLLMLGIIPTIIGHVSMYFSLRYVSPTIVASTPMGEPVLASIMAWFLFQEAIGYPTFIGGSVTLIGLSILTRNK